MLHWKHVGYVIGGCSHEVFTQIIQIASNRFHVLPKRCSKLPSSDKVPKVPTVPLFQLSSYFWTSWWLTSCLLHLQSCLHDMWQIAVCSQDTSQCSKLSQQNITLFLSFDTGKQDIADSSQLHWHAECYWDCNHGNSNCWSSCWGNTLAVLAFKFVLSAQCEFLCPTPSVPPSSSHDLVSASASVKPLFDH